MSQGTQHHHPLVVKNYPSETRSAYLSVLKGACRTCKSYTKCPVRKQMALPFNLLNNYWKTKQKNKHYISSINTKKAVYYAPFKWNIKVAKTASIPFKRKHIKKLPDFIKCYEIRKYFRKDFLKWYSLKIIGNLFHWVAQQKVAHKWFAPELSSFV